MQFIRAKFIGRDGSLGYKTGITYDLIFEQLSFLEALFTGHKIRIWRMNSVSDAKSRTGYCIYGSMTAFLLNWNVIPDQRMVFEIETKEPYRVIRGN